MIHNTGANEPLKTPPELKKTTKWQIFLLGMPFLCVYGKTLRKVRRQLRERDASIDRLWPKDQELIALRDAVATKLMDVFAWPNKFFHPDDDCEVIFWYPYEDECVEMFEWMEQQYRVDLDTISDRIQELTFSQLLEELRQAIKERQT